MSGVKAYCGTNANGTLFIAAMSPMPWEGSVPVVIYRVDHKDVNVPESEDAARETVIEALRMLILEIQAAETLEEVATSSAYAEAVRALAALEKEG